MVFSRLLSIPCKHRTWLPKNGAFRKFRRHMCFYCLFPLCHPFAITDSYVECSVWALNEKTEWCRILCFSFDYLINYSPKNFYILILNPPCRLVFGMVYKWNFFPLVFNYPIFELLVSSLSVLKWSLGQNREQTCKQHSFFPYYCCHMLKEPVSTNGWKTLLWVKHQDSKPC